MTFYTKTQDSGSSSEVKKQFFMLKSAEHEIYPAHNVKMPTIVSILTLISMINTTSHLRHLKQETSLFFHILVSISSCHFVLS